MTKLFLGEPPDALWPAVVAASSAWATEHGVALRDAVCVVPLAQHLPPARQAWAQSGTWMPRIETTQTLARSTAAPEPATDHDICFDAALDGLTARRLLRGQAAFAGWQRRDARAFEHMVASLVQTAQALARALAALPPTQRAAHATAARLVLAPVGGAGQASIGGTERHLARIAFEWALATTAASTDALYTLRPSAWIVVQAGGIDALTQGLMNEAAMALTPVLSIATDPAGDDAVAAVAARARAQVQVCSGFEDEAQRAAAQVLADLSTHGAPVALIAQDRLLVRRVRALLDRQAVPVRDETGWTLSTTRAAASVGLLLRAAAPGAGADEVLDAIKSWPAAADDAAALAGLEHTLRRHRWSQPGTVDRAQLSVGAAALWSVAAQATEPLRAAGSQPLPIWCDRLRAALQRCSLDKRLAADDAGRQVLAALYLSDVGALASHAEPRTLTEFGRWVDDALEQATYIPLSPDVPAVVVTPAARAVLRPFAAIVWPGADEKRLGAAPSPHPLLSDAEAAALGLPTAVQRREREAMAFAQLLCAAPVTLLWRSDDGGEPLAASPLIEGLVSARREAGLSPLVAAADPRAQHSVPASPVARPLPTAAALLPERLSASACEALRACPYRFFALRMLGLQAADELDGDIEKRDYGTWLHAVLHRFHLARASARDDDFHALAAAATAVQAEMGLADADFLPFAATFERFVPRYVAWLHGRDEQGAQWLDGERDWTVRPEAWQGIAMQGVIDRIDSVAGPVTQLIDYKTGATQSLRHLMKRPQEDTQLPFYAALAIEQGRAAGEIGPLDAIYLSLDDAKAVIEVRHPDVAHSAAALVDGLGQDLARVRAGAALPALGEGSACEHCDARGLCRRDQWAALVTHEVPV